MSNRPKGFWLAIIGAILQGFSLRCMSGTILSHSQAFIELGKISRTGSPDPSQLTATVAEALIAINVGMLAALVGAAMILIAIHFKRYRAPWLFWLLTIVGVLYLPALPLGTLIGIGFLILAFATRKAMLASR